MKSDNGVPWMDEASIMATLERCHREDASKVREVLAKALELKGLEPDDVGVLIGVTDPDLMEEVFQAAQKVKQEIYGNRLVFFAPLYISNLCKNECLYCAFRKSNPEVKRRVLDQEEIAAETLAILRQGHKRILVVAGESYPEEEGFDYILKTIATVYATREGNGEIRRVNVNLAPLPVHQFRQLKEAGIGTFQLFQETYHRETYARVHPSGPKSNYAWRTNAMDRAMEGGIDDVGMGVLFGLYDWRFEILAMMRQVRHLEERFGVGCHTLSVPRMEPAVGSEMATNPPNPVSDEDFLKLVAILRLAVPYTGFIMSTRESPEMRTKTLATGVSQISAGSRTNPGGYLEDIQEDASQFHLGDHRSLAEVIKNVCELGYIPSFCTACYRLGRTGQDFMDLAKPGLIKEKCAPNALSTFMEYLIDYAPPDTRAAGEAAIERELASLADGVRPMAERLIERVKAGKRDVYC